MNSLLAKVSARLDTPERRKFVRYTVVSLVSVVVTEAVLMICYGLLHLSGGWSGFIASTIAAVPSFYLNRTWVWGKTGRSHLTKEVLPFWVMAFIGLALSAVISGLGDDFAKDATNNHVIRTLIVTGSNVLGFALLWVLKFIIFNKVLFVHRESELDPALDGRSGIPT